MCFCARPEGDVMFEAGGILASRGFISGHGRVPGAARRLDRQSSRLAGTERCAGWIEAALQIAVGGTVLALMLTVGLTLSRAIAVLSASVH